MVLVALVVLLLVFSGAPAEAKDCKTLKNGGVWKHSAGMFRRVLSKPAIGTAKPEYIWNEYDDKGQLITVFREVRRAQRQALLANDEHGVEVLLQNEVCALKQAGSNQFQQLYQGSFVRFIDCT